MAGTLKSISLQSPARGRNIFRGDPGPSHCDPAGHSCGWGHSERAPVTEPSTHRGKQLRFKRAEHHGCTGNSRSSDVSGWGLPMTTVLSLLHQLLPPDNARLGTWSRSGSTSQCPAGGMRRGEPRPCFQLGSLCWLSCLSGSQLLLRASSRVLEQSKGSVGEGYF